MRDPGSVTARPDDEHQLVPPPPPPPTDGPARAPAPNHLGRLAAIGFQVLLTIHTLLLLAQPVWAGLFLSGDYERLATHRDTALIIMATSSFLFVLAVIVWWCASWPTWLPVLAFVLISLEGIQLSAGYDRQLGLHLPLGVVLVVGLVQLTGWAFAQPIAPVRRLSDLDPRRWRRDRRSAGGALDAPGRPVS